MTSLHALVARWKAEAAVLTDCHADPLARLTQRHVDDLEAALRAHDDAPLTLAEASAECGLSVDHLRHLVADGVIPNAGRKNRPLIRRGDLAGRVKPKKTPPLPSGGYDVAADARDLLARRRGR